MEINGISAQSSPEGPRASVRPPSASSPRAGAKVVVVDIEPARRARPSPRRSAACSCQADVADTDQVIAAVEAAKELGPLEALVNCAGIGWATRTIGEDGEYESAHDLDIFKKVIEINLIGTFNCIRLAATAMSPERADEADNERGAIVNTRVGGRLRRPDRPGLLLRLQGRRGRHDPPHRPRPLRRRHPGEHASLPGLIDTPIYGAGRGVGAFKERLERRRALPRSASAPRRVRHAGRRAAVEQLHERRVDPHRWRHADAAQVI